MQAVVTGGAGFIGHHLVAGLLAAGHQVRVIDDFSAGLEWRLSPFRERIALIRGSILEARSLDAAVAGCEVIFHEAAIASVAQSLAKPRQVDEVNAIGTIEVMLAAARHGVRRVVLAGSSAAYGASPNLPYREDGQPTPVSPYGASKVAAELYLHCMGRQHGIATVALRYFNVYGPSQDPTAEYAAVVPRFITAAIDGRRPIINGSGDISRDFIYIDDVVAANLAAAEDASPSGLTCNIASGRRTTLLELHEAVCAAARRRLEPRLAPARPGDAPHSQADISLARRALGFEAHVGLEDGIARTLEWFRGDGAQAAWVSRGG